MIFLRLLSCHVGAPDSLSRGLPCPYQTVFTLFNIGIGFTRANGVDSYTFQSINPNFRVGQLSNFVKSKVVFILCFEQKYIINIFCQLLLSSTVVGRGVGCTVFFFPLSNLWMTVPSCSSTLPLPQEMRYRTNLWRRTWLCRSCSLIHYLLPLPLCFVLCTPLSHSTCIRDR